MYRPALAVTVCCPAALPGQPMGPMSPAVLPGQPINRMIPVSFTNTQMLASPCRPPPARPHRLQSGA